MPRELTRPKVGVAERSSPKPLQRPAARSVACCPSPHTTAFNLSHSWSERPSSKQTLLLKQTRRIPGASRHRLPATPGKSPERARARHKATFGDTVAAHEMGVPSSWNGFSATGAVGQRNDAKRDGPIPEPSKRYSLCGPLFKVSAACATTSAQILLHWHLRRQSSIRRTFAFDLLFGDYPVQYPARPSGP